MGIPNYITVFRILLIPIVVLFFYIPMPWSRGIAASIFAMASITDWLDGYLARTMGKVSHFGAFLDPVADKLLVSIALVLLVSDRNLTFISFPALVIVGREVVISALREWMADIGKRTSVAVSYVGKIKTVLQMLAITILLAYHPVHSKGLKMLGVFSLHLAAVLTLWSMVMYLKAAWPEMTYHK